MNLNSEEYTIVLRDPIKETIKVRFLLSSQPDDNWKLIFDRKTSVYSYSCNKVAKSIDCVLTMNQLNSEIDVVISEIKSVLIIESSELD